MKKVMFVGIPADVAQRILIFHDAIQLNAHEENELFDHDFDELITEEDKEKGSSGIDLMVKEGISFEELVLTRSLKINRTFCHKDIDYVELSWNCINPFQQRLLAATGKQVPIAISCLEFKYDNDNFQDVGGKGTRIGGSIIKGAKSFVEITDADGVRIEEVDEEIEYWTEEKQDRKLKELEEKNKPKRKIGRNTRKNS
ncbi:MAG: hypothetical protein AB8G11_22380 [Saprospiraceae bacterium]